MKKIINYDDVSGENRKEQKPHWSQIFDHPYRIFIIGGSVCGKANVLLNSVNSQPVFYQLSLYDKDPYEVKHQLLIKKVKVFT